MPLICSPEREVAEVTAVVEVMAEEAVAITAAVAAASMEEAEVVAEARAPV